MFMSKQCHSSMKFLEELINLKYIFHLKNFLTFLLHAIMKNDVTKHKKYEMIDKYIVLGI